MNMPVVVTGKELAARIGCKPSYIVELKRAGRLVPSEDAKGYLLAESLALYESTRDPSRAGVAARHAANRAATAAKAGQGAEAAPAPPPAAGEAEEEPTANPADRHSERRAKAMADKEEALAEAAIRANRQAMGQLLDAKEVDGVIASAGTGLRKALERLPDSLAPQLAPISEEAKVRAILVEAIEEALREIARQFGALAKGSA